jgi:glycine/D-amino acid oxidase-like deaminating enzyme
VSFPSRAEVVIVGGGCMGASIAYHLTARGLSDVLLVERGTLACGPTGRSTAILRRHYSQPLLVRMAEHGLRTYSQLEELIGAGCGFVRTGLVVGVDPADRAALDHNIEVARVEGVHMELLDDVEEIDPRIDGGNLDYCLEPEAGYCDPYLATASFAAAARRAGTTVAEGVEAEAVGPGEVRTTAGTVHAGAVVVVAGPWSPRLLAPLGYELPLRSARAEVGRFRLPADYGPPLPALADFSASQLYFKPGEPGFIEVGSLSPDHAERPIDPDACPEGAEAETLAGYGDALRARLRGAERGHWRGSWSAVYDVTPDWHPAIGAVPGVDGVFVAAGFSGHGFKLAPAVGMSIADLVCDGPTTTFDLNLLDPARFERNELVSTTYGYSVLG